MISRVLGARLLLTVFGLLSVSVMFVALSRNAKELHGVEDFLRERRNEKTFKINADEDLYQKLIFIGGMPRSGTTLMRKMLESHPDIRCGPETHVIPDILDNTLKWTKNTAEFSRLVEAGVAPKPLERALGKFILNVVVHHSSESKYYCNKDPYALSHIGYLYKIFPNIKFILMIRDGRAVAHSIVSRKVGITGFNISNYRDVIFKWDRDISQMYDQCLKVGSDVCFVMYYEQLVLRPVENTKRLFEFLDIPWTSDVLHHEKHINETHLSTFEMSTDQVQRPLYLDALTKWCDEIPNDVKRDIPFLAPTLRLLGYNPFDNNPTYGEPDDFVLGKLTI